MSRPVIRRIDEPAISNVIEAARASARRRAIICFHDGDWEHCHRMLNALLPGTYVQPHRHPDRYKGEGFILLRGKLALLIFDEDGNLNQKRSCILSHEEGNIGMEIPPGIWHSLVALEESVIYEVKGQPAGGYVQATDKEFASWAPAEEESEVEPYLRLLENEARKLNDSFL